MITVAEIKDETNCQHADMEGEGGGWTIKQHQLEAIYRQDT